MPVEALAARQDLSHGCDGPSSMQSLSLSAAGKGGFVPHTFSPFLFLILLLYGAPLALLFASVVLALTLGDLGDI